MALKDALLPEFDHEMAVTRRVLERVPVADNAWKPHDKSFSLGALAAHLANLPVWVEVTLAKDGFDLSAPAGPPRSVHETTADLLATFDRNVAAARTHIASTPDAVFAQPWTLRTGDDVVFTQPKAGVLRSFVLNHMVHHRGQMSVYLRLRDVPVPSIYGPSADER